MNVLDPNDLGRPQPVAKFSDYFTGRLKLAFTGTDCGKHTGLIGSWGFLEPKSVAVVLVTLALCSGFRAQLPLLRSL